MSSPITTTDKENEKNKEIAPVPFQVQKHDILSNKSVRYLVLDFNGEGHFGKVAKCVNLKTSETTAIKIHKKSEYHSLQREVGMLEELRALDPEKKNLVRFIDSFMFQDLPCLAFEMLDRSLWDLMKEREMQLTLNEIRPITHQLLVALEALKGIGIVHTDLKPDNIMLVNHQDQPFRVKLIDFGLALPASKIYIGMNVQTRAYRAPEVTLGLPISEAIDMWGLGCVMAYLYFGSNLFPGKCSHHTMKAICHLLGQPGDHLLSAGKNTWQYFSRDEGSTNPGWRLRTAEEYEEATGAEPQISEWVFDIVGNLEEAVDSFSEEDDDVEYKDRMAFLHLLKRMLHLESEKRFTPGQALKHCFITMAHLEEDMDTSSYADAAFEFMTVCPLDESDDSLSDSEADIEPDDSSDGVSTTDDTDIKAYFYDPPYTARRTDLRTEPSTDSSCYGDTDLKAYFYDPPYTARRTGLRTEPATADLNDHDGGSCIFSFSDEDRASTDDDSFEIPDTDSSSEEEWVVLDPVMTIKPLPFILIKFHPGLASRENHQLQVSVRKIHSLRVPLRDIQTPTSPAMKGGVMDIQTPTSPAMKGGVPVRDIQTPTSPAMIQMLMEMMTKLSPLLRSLTGLRSPNIQKTRSQTLF
ncbi:homeodomain-interacting protein kinase 1-like [Siniperca chuatsi]|uniref:homeodomain-interacting protein kinase 1-like n=1 Tax=Siniperca chuatsi TaxID=119488 RepID=UPI001CE1A199|nr:homeodomain-interacting protein kinase 1-like [Siniperca chuatsi]